MKGMRVMRVMMMPWQPPHLLPPPQQEGVASPLQLLFLAVREVLVDAGSGMR